MVDLIGMHLGYRKVFSLGVAIKQGLTSIAKEISVFFGRNHRHIPNMHLILRNETRLVALEVKMDVNQKLSFSLAGKSEAKFLLMPSLTNPADILQRLAF